MTAPEREALAACCQERLSVLEAEAKQLRAFVSELAEETRKSMSILEVRCSTGDDASWVEGIYIPSIAAESDK